MPSFSIVSTLKEGVANHQLHSFSTLSLFCCSHENYTVVRNIVWCSFAVHTMNRWGDGNVLSLLLSRSYIYCSTHTVTFCIVLKWYTTVVGDELSASFLGRVSHAPTALTHKHHWEFNASFYFYFLSLLSSCHCFISSWQIERQEKTSQTLSLRLSRGFLQMLLSTW